MTISALPTAPSRSQSPQAFADTMDTWIAALPNFVTEANALSGTVNSDAGAAAASAADAATSAGNAASSEAVAMASANFKGAWSSLTGPLNKPASVSHNGKFWVLLNNLADVTASQPGVTGDWAEIKTAPNVRVTATGVSAADNDFIYVTAAAQTITLPASPLAGDRVWVAVGAFVNTVIGRNGKNIMSLAEDMTINAQNVTVTLVYVDATRGWVIV